MKKFILAISAVTLLAACGSKEDPRQVLIDECMSEPEATTELCSCMSDAMVDNLDKDDVSKMITAIKSGEDSDAYMEKMMGDLMADESKVAAASAMGNDVMTCMMAAME